MVTAVDSGLSSPGSSPGQARALRCVLGYHKLPTQGYKWVLVHCWSNLTVCCGVTSDGLASHAGGNNL